MLADSHSAIGSFNPGTGPDHPTEECAVFGVYDQAGEVSRMVYFGLQALQHRGQESCGIASCTEDGLYLVKDMGLVAQVFTEESLVDLPGSVAVGHCRYSTSNGTGNRSMAQPYTVECGNIRFAFAHNGTLLNTGSLRSFLPRRVDNCTPITDTRAAAELLSDFAIEEGDLEKGIVRLMEVLEGAYSIIVATPEALYAFRDANGIRPLEVGQLPSGGWAVSSETCGLDIIGAEYVCSIEPGQIMRFDAQGMHAVGGIPPKERALCIFEYVYFARPDSVIEGRSVYQVRRNLGRILARESAVDADMVLGVPDSGIPSALGYAQESGIPYKDGIVKNRYVGRTFIQPTQAMRELGIRMKLNPLRSVIQGKRVIVIDDSIVRGSTSKSLVSMLRRAGAKEVHLRIVSPETIWPCFFGIDTDTQDQLLMANMTIEEACEYTGADSLAFLSIEGLHEAVREAGGLPGQDIPCAEGFCDACFSGNYPVAITDEMKAESFLLPEKLKK